MSRHTYCIHCKRSVDTDEVEGEICFPCLEHIAARIYPLAKDLVLAHCMGNNVLASKAILQIDDLLKG